jgi:hypothetical protein
MQNAINEMHNTGIIASLTGDAAAAVHNPDPEIRVNEKTGLAKSVGKSFIPKTMPMPSSKGLSYMAHLNYDARFVNSITLCFQGCIEGLRMSFGSNPNLKLDKYFIHVISGDSDLSALVSNLSLLDRMYEDISIVLMRDGKIIYQQGSPAPAQVPPTRMPPVSEPKPAEKKGFFAKLFGRK